MMYSFNLKLLMLINIDVFERYDIFLLNMDTLLLGIQLTVERFGYEP